MPNMKQKEKKIPKELLNNLNPLLNSGENIICVFKEPFHWQEMQTRWLILTDFRLAVVSKSILGMIHIEDFHIRDLDIELERTRFGFLDTIVFKSRDKILYQTGASKSRRAVVEDFVRTATLAISNREMFITMQKNNNNNHVSTPTNCDSITTIRELNKLREEGAITEAEYLTKKEEILKKI